MDWAGITSQRDKGKTIALFLIPRLYRVNLNLI